MLKKFLNILDSKKKLQLVILIFLYLPLNIIETLSLTSIPGFIIFIDDPGVLYKYFNHYSFIALVDKLSFNERVYFGSISLICIFIIRGLFIFLINSYGFYLKYKITMSNSRKLYLSYLSKPYKFHINNNASNLAQNLSDSLKSTVVVMAYANIIKDIILLTFIFCVIYIATPNEFLKIILFTILPTLILFMTIKNKLKKLGKIGRNFRLAAHKSLIEGFSNIKYILIKNSKKIFLKDYYKKQQTSQKQDTFLAIFNILPRIIIELACLSFVILFIIINVNLSDSINSFLPTLTLIVVAAVRIIPALGQISVNSNSIKFQSYTVDRINSEILNWKKEKKNEIDKSKIQKIQKFNKKISLRNITFSYVQEKPVIKNLSIDLTKNQKIGISGPSGSGKTTVTDIILGLLKPDKGEVICDEVNINEDINGWRKLISFVPQNIILLDDTIENNISFNFDNKEINKDRYNMALKVSGLDKVIDQFPQKDQTRIGFFANKISGGQKQRIGIARALYEEKPILILDEATNSLDKSSENIIIDMLFKSNQTIILVSHDLDLIKKCDNKLIINA